MSKVSRIYKSPNRHIKSGTHAYRKSGWLSRNAKPSPVRDVTAAYIAAHSN